MEFEIVEIYMIFDELGGIKEILLCMCNDVYKLIEECMLLVNVVVVEYVL